MKKEDLKALLADMSLQEKADQMMEKAQTAIAEEKEKELKEMESDIAALAMDAAEKILEENKGGWF